MDFRDLLDTLRRFWRISALVAVAIIGLGAVASFVPQKEYQTSATIILEFSPDVEVSIQQVNFILPGIEEQARSRTLRNAAEARVSEPLRNKPAIISASADASVVRVSATATSPRAAQEWADAVALELIGQRNTGDGPLQLALLDPAPLRRAPVSPDVVPIMAAAVMVGLISAVFAALLSSRLVSALRSEAPSVGVSPAERDRLLWRGIDPFDRVLARADPDTVAADGAPEARDVSGGDDDAGEPTRRVASTSGAADGDRAGHDRDDPDVSDDDRHDPDVSDDDRHDPDVSDDDQHDRDLDEPDPDEPAGVDDAQRAEADLAAEPEWAAPDAAGTGSRLGRSSRRPFLRLAAPMFVGGGIVAAGLLLVR